MVMKKEQTQSLVALFLSDRQKYTIMFYGCNGMFEDQESPSHGHMCCYRSRQCHNATVSSAVHHCWGLQNPRDGSPRWEIVQSSSQTVGIAAHTELYSIEVGSVGVGLDM